MAGRGLGRGRQGVTCVTRGVPMREDREVLEVDGGHGGGTVWLYSMPGNCTLNTWLQWSVLCYGYFPTVFLNYRRSINIKKYSMKNPKRWHFFT